MLVTEFVEVKISKTNIDHYRSKGYKCQLKEVINVKTIDLTIGSHQIIEVKCDYCEKDLKMEFRTYLKQLNKTIIKEDCCSQCSYKKREKILMIEYGVTNPMHLQSTKDNLKNTLQDKYGVENYSQTEDHWNKVKVTMMNKFGVEHYSQTEEFKEKTKETNQKKYGVDYYTQTEEYKIRAKNTSLERYGTEYPIQSEIVKNKVEKTNLERYGATNPFSSDIVREKIKQYFIDSFGVEHNSQTDDFKFKMKSNWNEWRDNGRINSILEKRVDSSMQKYGVPYPMQNQNVSNKAFTTMYKNGTAPTSKQQKYIHSLIGGELNMPVGRASLDISFPQDKIYVEYDGGGHDLSVLMGNVTRKEFELKERRRGYFLKDNGWKEIRIITSDDILPVDNVITRFVGISKSFLLNDLGFSVRWNLNRNEVLVNYKHTYSLEEFFNKYKVKEAIS